MFKIASGMAELHRLGVVHRDLKAQNIRITGDIQAKVGSFEQAKEGFQCRINPTDDIGNEIISKLSLKWLAPEVLLNNPTDLASDVWAFGVTLWEMFNFGETPYPGKQQLVNQ